MTFANDGFFSSTACFILTTSPPSPSQPGMQPCLGAHSWSPDLWAHYYTPNRCTAVSKHHDPPTFDPTCTCATAPANLAPSTEDLKHIYPSPPHTDSDPKHTVPLPTLSEDSPSHAEGTSSCPHSGPLTLPCPPTPPTQAFEGPLTSHPSTQDLPLSPPPSLPMVPHALPEATTSCYTLDRVVDARDDTDMEPDTADNESQSSSSPDEPPSSDLLTPLSPMWDLPLDDDDTRPAGILEVSTHLSRPLVSSPPRLPAPAVQATEGDRMTLPCGSNPTKWDLDSKVESQCGLLRPFVVPPDGLAGARFAMFQAFFPPPAFDGLPSDGFLGHSYPSSRGKLFIDAPSFLLSETGSPYILPKLTLVAPQPRLPRRISLPSPSPEEPPVDTGDALVSCCHGIGAPQPSGATTDMPRCASANSSPVSHKGTEPSVGITILSQWDHSSTPEVAPRSPLGEFEDSSIVGSGSGVTSNLGPITAGNIDSFDHASLDWDNFEQDVVPPSPSHRTMSHLDDFGDESGDDSAPSSPSRRSFADLPDATMDEHLISPPQSPLLSGQPLLTLPGAEPDNTLIIAEASVSDWSAPSPPRGSGLGLFLPIQAASSNQFQASEPHAIEPNLYFSPEAIARVDSREFEKLKSVRRRTWVSERKAKEDEIYHAKRAEHLASRLSVAPPVPSKLPDFDERGGVSAGADAEETEGPPGEPAQLDESDEKTIRTWLLYTEARRADARRLRKREKELGRELQALLRLKLGEDPVATEGGVRTFSEGAKVKPGKTAIVSMPQLVARMIMKRRDTPRLFSPRKHDAPYIFSPLSRFEPTVGES
jgi:hypothetical protein